MPSFALCRFRRAMMLGLAVGAGIMAASLGKEELAHQIRPEPHSAAEILMWEPRCPKLPAEPGGNSLLVFPTSGLTFLRSDDLRVSVRAGEF